MKKIITLIFLMSILLISFSVNISAGSFSSAPHITVTLLNQDPDPVRQGDVVEARFKIENDGSETSDNVEVEILPKYPFTLYSGDAIRQLGKLRAGQTGSDAIIVDYKLKVDSLAEEGDNEIELQLKIGDVVYSYTNNEFLIDIESYTKPNLKTYIKENTIFAANTKGTVTVEVANVDITDVKFLQLTLLPNKDYNLLSSNNYVYLGDVDSDDTESEDFEIYVSNPKDGKIEIPIKLEYQDSNENKFSEERTLSFNVYPSKELSKYGLIKKNYTKYIILIIVIGIILWYIKKRKKRR